MKLYYSKGACSLASRIIINELGLNSEFESVDLKAKKTQTGANYLDINAKGSVPALLLDNNELLTENAVIMQYLAETNNAKHLLPDHNNFQHYRVLEWLNFIAADLHKTIGMLFNPNLTEEMKEKIAFPMIKAKMTFVDKQLYHKKYLTGNDFTLPDAYLFVMLTWLTNFKINITEWQYLSRYFAELKKRRSIQQSLEEENLRLAPA